jgi:hypothetical protein
METILRSDVVRALDEGNPFTMEFITADRRRGTGGKLIKLENWVKHAGQPVDDTLPGAAAAGEKKKKDPGHYRHGTINVMNPGNKAIHITKVHIPLIQTFNGKKVVNG